MSYVKSDITPVVQQKRVEHYKIFENYKNLEIINDDISTKIKNLYDNNKWNLKDRFKDLQEHYEELGIKTEIAWNNKIQYLDYTVLKPPLNTVSLKAFKEGEYNSKYKDKKSNSIKTETGYANRIIFFTKTFASLKEYQDQDDLSWIIANNRLLMYEIMNYHDSNNRTVSTMNNDFKTIVRVIKLLLGEEDELRFKYSALQIAFSDIENIKDDDNVINTVQEIRQFISHEELLKICDKLEEEYNKELDKLPLEIKKDGLKHSNKLFNQHQILLAVALNVWDYPSRHEKFDLTIIQDENQATIGNNFVVIPKTNKVCKMIFNEIVKDHKPLSYNIESTAIADLNKKLDKLLKYSLRIYQRPYLFIGKDRWKSQKLDKITPLTVSDWLRDLVSNKNMGIDGLRSSFVSYYYPRFNNRQKNVMCVRMRTSKDVAERSYLKKYNSQSNEIVKINIDPLSDNDTKVRKRRNFKKWCENGDNRSKYLEKVRIFSAKKSTYQRRLLRELNSGKIDFKKMKDATISAYSIKFKDGIYYTDNEIKD